MFSLYMQYQRIQPYRPRVWRTLCRNPVQITLTQIHGKAKGFYEQLLCTGLHACTHLLVYERIDVISIGCRHPLML